MRYNILPAAALAAMCVTLGAAAQQQPDLTRQIELEKEVVPVEKKATKKNKLPGVAPSAITAPPATLRYADGAVLTDVPATIPTMQPYGYRTLHNFSDSRGYFDFGGGTHANFTGSLGYRILDSEATKLAAWVQHNSTWAGRNTSTVEPVWGIDPATLGGTLGGPVKQEFNDNLLGIDFSHKLGAGTLLANGRLHFDSFNYYGGRSFLPIGNGIAQALPTIDWQALKQSYFAADLAVGWESTVAIGDRSLGYNAALSLGYAALSKALDTRHDKGAKDFDLRVDLGATYTLNDNLTLGLDLSLERDAFNNHANAILADWTGLYYNKRNKLLFTALPNIAYRGGNVSLLAGLRVDVTNADAEIYDGAKKVSLSPELNLDVALGRGIGLFATATGGRVIDRITTVHDNYRYANPNAALAVRYTPVEALVGLNIGPFSGFSAKAYVGYGMSKFTNNALVMPASAFNMALMGGSIQNIAVDCSGMIFGAELEYKYRSLLEARLKWAYAPSDDDFDAGHGYMTPLSTAMEVAGISMLNRTGVTYSGYCIDEYGSSMMLEAEVDVHPIKRLTVGVGFELRKDISIFAADEVAVTINDDGAPDYNLTSHVGLVDVPDIINLKAHARYQFNKTLAAWVKADNLLGRHYDLNYGMGAQRFAVIAGLAVNF